jgi:competence ComEA-like helix-hairpin-helix protein
MDERSGRVDLNLASVEGLIELSGIGPVLAQRIVAARPFAGVEDLLRVQGIGPDTLERLRPFIGVSAAPGGLWVVERGTEGEAEEGEPALPEPAARSAEILSLPEQDLEAERATVELEVKAPETVPLSVPEGEQAEEADKMQERETIDRAEPIEAKVVEAEVVEAEFVEQGAAPWEEEPIPGWDDEFPIPEEIPFEDQDIPMPDEAPPVVEAARVVEVAPERKPPAVTRARVGWMALLSIVLATLLATLLSLAILSYLNGGQLQYVTPDRFAGLSTRAEGLEAQAGVLVQDVEGLRKRLDNLEALSGRLNAVEQAGERMQADLKATAGEVDQLATQARALEAQAAELAQQAEEVETRVSTLETQGSRAQAFLEGLAELMSRLFPPEASTP